MGRNRSVQVLKRGGPTSLGVYEKTLAPIAQWGWTFAAASQAGFSFFELSVDPSRERLNRLKWSPRQRANVRLAAHNAGLSLRVLTLSAHRVWPWGSAESATRKKATDLARQAIDLAVDLGIECIQIAGYFTFDGSRSTRARELFVEGLSSAATYAASAGIVLALENVDGTDVTSVSRAQEILQEVDASNLYLYIDVGNLAGNQLNVPAELRAGLANAYCVQLKDARPGAFRRVPFGAGAVPFKDVFDILVSAKPVPISVEMWNDGGNPSVVQDAARWVQENWSAAQARRAHTGR